MVSADNLNLDVLELIFAYLSGHDLTCVGLVSRSFLAGAIPTLYRNIVYRLREAKAYDTIMSPFAVLLSHKGLSKHVRTIDLQAIPRTNHLKIRPQPHSGFMRDCRKAIELCDSLHTFRCTESNVVPAFLMALQNKPNLQQIRLHGSLTPEQTKLLVNLNSGLTEVFLEYASWNVVDALPKWTAGLHRSLQSLVLYRTEELNEGTLESILKELPELKGLHVIQCPRVDQATVLNLVSHTPALEALSFTTMENGKPIGTIPPLPSLQHLALDARYHKTPSPTPAILMTLLDNLKASAPTLSSFSIKLPERKITIPPTFIDRLIEVYGTFLKKLSFLDCEVELVSIEKIAEECSFLERLDVSIPIRDVYAFASTLGSAENLHTLVDVESHVAHGVHPSLNLEMVEYLMESVPSLRKVVSGRRVWVPEGIAEDFDGTVRLDRRLPYRSRPSWFLPATTM
ncbi:hypothetical protein DFP72DRAFT_472600 [Ephemerocybe angulata]|uniref:F-box domain-containing protein n=1 Tax=Ephemerocybe angulata TaxID=980116 RepID=A0A8H6M167_9AGAR|nr:hypothetical protein DFP72DRAFT_472600 [Tulosesus angulatus]